MHNALLMNFSADKENKEIRVERAFAAGLDKVWPAWTEKEILDKWWAPKPWRAETKSMDFRVGGRWHYAMVSPEGEKHWCIADYDKVEPKKAFACSDAFCDEDQHINENFARSHWHVRFEDQGERTLVHISITYKSEEAMQQILEMGFKEGFTAGLQNLDEVLAKG